MWIGIGRRISGAAGLAGGVLGMGGWRDDAQAWADWAVMNPQVAGVLVGAGSAMFVTWVVLEVLAFLNRNRKNASAQKPTIQQTFVFNAGPTDRETERNFRDAAQSETLSSLQDTIDRMAMKRLGEEHMYSTLPEGTNIVKHKDGKVTLALPVMLSANMSGKGVGKITMGSTIEKSNPS